jgi:hypothetical protein
LSPSINDPTTAVQVIDRVTELLRAHRRPSRSERLVRRQRENRACMSPSIRSTAGNPRVRGDHPLRRRLAQIVRRLRNVRPSRPAVGRFPARGRGGDARAAPRPRSTVGATRVSAGSPAPRRRPPRPRLADPALATTKCQLRWLFPLN